MSRSRRLAGLLLLALAMVALVATTALAQEESDSGEEPTTISETGLEPAIPVPDDEASESLADWTYRYMIPATLVLVVVVIVGVSIWYFTRVVRNRYRTVQE